MDLCLSEAGMKRCQNDHIFCDSHAMDPTVSLEEKREAIIKKEMECGWREPDDKKKRISNIQSMKQNEVEDTYDEYNQNEVFPEYCPICQMTEVCNNDIVKYALIQLGFKTTKELALQLKNQFGTYDKFREYLKR
jgi:superoxide dismutase